MAPFTATMIVMLWLVLSFFGHLSAQTFFQGQQVYVYAPGITESCYRALNSTLDCSLELLTATYKEPATLGLSRIRGICMPSCLESLRKAQEAAAKACTSEADVLWDKEKLVAIPATWKIDRFLYAFNETCVMDSFGELCASHRKFGFYEDGGNSSCSPCALNAMASKLKSPLRYSDREARQFNSTLSSCNATGYNTTPPAPLALNGDPSERAPLDAYLGTPTPIGALHCDGEYKVFLNETYNSIAAKKNASAHWLRENHRDSRDVDLDEVLQVGITLCLPPGLCELYTMKEKETCEDIVSKAAPEPGLSKLKHLNPKLCDDPSLLNGSVICISPPAVPNRLAPRSKPKSGAGVVRHDEKTFTGCLEDWDKYWPGKPYQSCWSPLAPSSCSSERTVPPGWEGHTPVTPKSVDIEKFMRCTMTRKHPLTEGDCAPDASTSASPTSPATATTIATTPTAAATRQTGKSPRPYATAFSTVALADE